ATSVSFDFGKQESIEVVFKMIGTPIVITAQVGGIKLDETLESQRLYRVARSRSRSQPDLPITDAGPGFVAEFINITVSTAYYFPKSEKDFKNRSSYSFKMLS